MSVFSVKTQKASVVGPLMTSKWNQDKYYNTLCPDEANASGGYDDRVPNGCVALAMAQIMYYHRFPYKGTGSSAYNAPGYGLQSADYAAANYNYEAMSDVATEYSNAIAILCYHAGVSVQMGYGKDGSGTQSGYVPDALFKRFKYKLSRQIFKNIVSNEVWISTLKGNLNNGLPVYYSAMSTKTPSSDDRDARHAFVCDGYDDLSGVDYFHFNFGWGGYSDGFYTLDSICEPRYAYIYENTMIVDIEPLSPPATVSKGHETLTATYGSFTDGSSPRVNYENNTDRSWLISPQNGRNITRIVLKTAYFETEQDKDFVTIYEGNSSAGNVIAVLSGNKDTTLYIQASEAYVTFRSDDANVARGFKFTYVTTKTPTFVCTDGELSAISPSVIKDPAVVIDPTDGARYDDEGACYWALKASNANEWIGVTFTRFDLAEGDWIDINKWNGSLGLVTVKYQTHKVGRFTKENPPVINREYVVQSMGASIRFKTDNNLNGTGFTLKWRITGEGVSEPSAGIEKLSIYPNPATDRVKIQLETLQPETIQINLYDVVGREISKIIEFDAKNQHFFYDMDVSNLEKGVYMLKISTSKGQVMRKLIIK